MLATKTLLIAGEGGVHTNAAGERVALLRAYDKATGADVGAVNMPAKQTGSPMSYMINGRQYIVVAVSGVNGAEIDRLRPAPVSCASVSGSRSRQERVRRRAYRPIAAPHWTTAESAAVRVRQHSLRGR